MAGRESAEQLRKGLELAVKEAKSLLVVVDDISKSISKTGVNFEKSFKGLDLSTSKDQAKLNKLLKQSDDLTKKKNTTDKEATRIKKEELALQKQLKAATDKEVEGKIRLQKANREQKQILADNLILRDKEAGTLEKLNAANRKLVREKKKLILVEGKENKRLKEINAQLDKNNARLQKNASLLGKQKINIGNYSSALGKAGGALRSLGVALGITAGITALVSVMRNAVKIAKDFEQGNANLAAILGKTSKDIVTLTNDAKRLGAVTAFTATQVSELQTEFAKLGFNETEILDATEATLNLAAATGSNLAEAAAIAGATLGGFGLNADQTARVTDVMAKSFSTSALDLEKFKESMKDAAPAAKAVGISVEKTTALLGALSNAGISGSKAGTALRAGFIKLNDAGLTLDESLEKIATSNDKLSTATELVGVRAATAFLVLSEGVDTVTELEIGLNNAGGSAKKMADEQLNTLAGKTKILNSAWEGFVLSLLAGDSAFNSMSKSIVETTTKLLGLLTPSEELADSWFAQRDAVEDLESNLNPLLDRYDELEGQTERTKDEQIELDSILNTIAETVPLAVTEFDKFGKAMDVSTDAARKLLQQTKDLLALDNAEAIREQEEVLVVLDRRLTKLNQTYQIQDGVLFKYNRELEKATNGRRAYLKATEDEARAFTTAGEVIRKDIADREAKIRKLKGEKTAIELNAEAAAKAAREAKEAAAKAATAAATKAAADAKAAAAAKKAAEKQAKLDAKADARAKRLEEKRKAGIISAAEREAQVINEIEQAQFDGQIANLQELAKLEEEGSQAQIDLLNKAHQLERNQLIAQAEFEISLEGATAEEIELIREELKNDLAAIDDDELKVLEEKLGKRKELYEESVEVIDKLFTDFYAKRQDDIEKDVTASQDAQSRIQAGIEAGNEDARKSLAAEERREVELERKKELARKKAQRAEAAIALLKVLGENADQPNALGKTLADYGAILAAIQAAPSFFEGTDRTDSKVLFDDSHGGITGFVHKDEMVFSQKDRSDVGFRTRDQIKDIVSAHERNLITDSSVSLLQVDNGGLILEVQKMQKSIATLHERMPVSSYEYDQVANQHIAVTKYQNRVVKLRKKADESWA